MQLRDRPIGHARDERLTVILVGQRLGGHGHLQELAKRLPTVGHLPHEQPIRRDRLFDPLVECEHPRDQLLWRLMAGGERRARSPEQTVDQLEITAPARVDLAAGVGQQSHQRLPVAHRPDRLAVASLPGARLANAEQDLGVGVALGELAVEEATRPVSGRLIAAEDLLPDVLTFESSVPQLDLVHVGDQVHPVVARVESELLERHFLRQGAGAG